jgi:hypothetical protein
LPLLATKAASDTHTALDQVYPPHNYLLLSMKVKCFEDTDPERQMAWMKYVSIIFKTTVEILSIFHHELDRDRK